MSCGPRRRRRLRFRLDRVAPSAELVALGSALAADRGRPVRRDADGDDGRYRRRGVAPAAAPWSSLACRWCAAADRLIVELRTAGGTLEDAYLELVARSVGTAGWRDRMSRPASLAAATLAQATMELRLTARRGENVLVTIVIPVVVLLFFASVARPADRDVARPVDFLLPGALALAVIATSLVNLGIATAYERNYGVLKRLGGSPLTRGGLLTAKMRPVLVVEVAQVVLLVAIASGVLGWRPGPGGVRRRCSSWRSCSGRSRSRASGCCSPARSGRRPRWRSPTACSSRSCCSAGSSSRSSHLPGPLATVAGLLPGGRAGRRLPGRARGRPVRTSVGRSPSLAAWGIGAVGLARSDVPLGVGPARHRDSALLSSPRRFGQVPQPQHWRPDQPQDANGSPRWSRRRAPRGRRWPRRAHHRAARRPAGRRS